MKLYRIMSFFFLALAFVCLFRKDKSDVLPYLILAWVSDIRGDLVEIKENQRGSNV